ncbi:MAG: hypothetical protein ACXU85_00995 [Xanthobacteraceae bacterium]
MKTVRLYQDHTEHRDGKAIRHKAGSIIDLPDDEADFVIRATLSLRAANKALAENMLGTPERERKDGMDF